MKPQKPPPEQDDLWRSRLVEIIDLRHYMEAELDMHHSSASFAARSRMLRAAGHADNQLIWMSEKPYTPIPEAFAVLDQWMLKWFRRPALGLLANKPELARDRCYDAQGQVVAEGKGVWDGAWNQRPQGACMEAYPMFSNSRIVSGAPLHGQLFKCQLQPVEQALATGLYGDTDMQRWQSELERIFPDGVCDYQLPDAALPGQLLGHLQARSQGAGYSHTESSPPGHQRVAVSK